MKKIFPSVFGAMVKKKKVIPSTPKVIIYPWDKINFTKFSFNA